MLMPRRFEEADNLFRGPMELHIRNLSKTYANGVHALKDVTLTIPHGLFGLLGPNGAGKKGAILLETEPLRALQEGAVRDVRAARVHRRGAGRRCSAALVPEASWPRSRRQIAAR
jgi:ABC-type branched-subunit amino acid transport system ATPase component